MDETFSPVSPQTSDSDSSESANSVVPTDDDLYAVMDPLDDSEIYGIDLYSCVLDFMDYALAQ